MVLLEWRFNSLTQYCILPSSNLNIRIPHDFKDLCRSTPTGTALQ